MKNWILKDIERGLEREEVSSILEESSVLIKETPPDACLYALVQASPKVFEGQ
ncbi:MAG: hypothetical protein LBB83_07500 [Treponema sp.]|nr:hypothetical protein [Treponema sp.]